MQLLMQQSPNWNYNLYDSKVHAYRTSGLIPFYNRWGQWGFERWLTHGHQDIPVWPILETPKPSQILFSGYSLLLIIMEEGGSYWSLIKLIRFLRLWKSLLPHLCPCLLPGKLGKLLKSITGLWDTWKIQILLLGESKQLFPCQFRRVGQD